MRALATIRLIAELRPIANADMIEIAQIDGWQCVVKKDDFAVGDGCVYFEIDSVLPVRAEFEFLRKGCHRRADWLPGGEGFRIKTIKLRGELSQGLALSLDACGVMGDVGDDVTSLLAVALWDPPLNVPSNAKGNFPSFIPKTDQERVQNCLGKLATRAGDHLFEATLKLDGSSCTIFAKDGALGVCSRNLELKIDESDNAFVRMGLAVADRVLSIGRNLAFQGELMGPGIQGNREGFADFRWFVFGVWDIDAQRHLSPAERHAIVHAAGLEHVPVLSDHVAAAALPLADLLVFSDSTASIGHPVAEGVVYKSHADPSVSFKVIANRFLLREAA